MMKMAGRKFGVSLGKAGWKTSRYERYMPKSERKLGRLLLTPAFLRQNIVY